MNTFPSIFVFRMPKKKSTQNHANKLANFMKWVRTKTYAGDYEEKDNKYTFTFYFHIIFLHVLVDRDRSRLSKTTKNTNAM